VYGRGCTEPGGGIVPAWGFVPNPRSRAVDFGQEKIHRGGRSVMGFGVGFKFQPWKGVAKFVTTAVKNEPVTHFVSDIAQGKSFKQSVSSAVKDGVHEFQTVAPMAETVVSFVPGVGTAASMALAAGVALSKGQKITEALVSTVKGALPGGPAVAAAFDTATQFGDGLLHHENLGQAALGAVRQAAVDAGSDVGVPTQLTESAFDTALALAHGKKLQEAGFAVMGDLAQGNDLAEKAINFGKAAAQAKTTGQHVADILTAQAVPVVASEVGFGQGEILAPLAVAAKTPSPWTVALATTVLSVATGWVIEEVAKKVRGRR
jgi:hypothetical protein